MRGFFIMVKSSSNNNSPSNNKNKSKKKNNNNNNNNNNNKKGGDWPYHEDPNGNMKPCASNPCKLHGGNDVYASSPDEAYAIKHANDSFGFSAPAKPVNPFAKEPTDEEKEKIAKSIVENYGIDTGLHGHITALHGQDWEPATNNAPAKTADEALQKYQPGTRVIVDDNGEFKSVILTGAYKYELSDGNNGVNISYINSNGMPAEPSYTNVVAVEGVENDFKNSFKIARSNRSHLSSSRLSRRAITEALSGTSPIIDNDARKEIIFKFGHTGTLIKAGTNNGIPYCTHWNGMVMTSYAAIPPDSKYRDYNEQELSEAFNDDITYYNKKTGVIGIDGGTNYNENDINARMQSITSKIAASSMDNEVLSMNTTHDYNAFKNKTSSFATKDISSSITKPAKNDNSGYMGGSLFIGGKYDAVKDKSQTEVAKIIRGDMTAMRKNGAIPPDWKVSVRKQTGAWMNGFDVSIKAPADSPIPVYKTPSYDDFNKAMRNWETRRHYSNMLADMEHDGFNSATMTRADYNAYMKAHSDRNYRILTDDARTALKNIQDTVDQYKYSNINGMVDYFHTVFDSRVDKVIELI